MNVVSSTFLVCFYVLLVAGCGAQATKTLGTRRVLDGEIIQNKTGFEWIARLTTSNGHRTIKCGGSVVGERWVLTAAHCIHFEHIYCDEVRIFPSTWFFGDQTTRRGEKCIVHPQHDWQDPYIEDIALIKCTENILNYPGFSIIALPQPDATVKEGDGVLIYGWGDTQGAPAEFSPSLRGAVGTVIKWSECDEKAKEAGIARANQTSPARTRWISEKAFCTRGQSSDHTGASCYGDSGGPVVKYNTVLLGIISGGLKTPDDKCEPMSVHTNIVDYLPWIHSTMDKE